MKIKASILFILVILLSTSLFAQKSYFNLKNLDHVCVTINDAHNLLSSQINQKLLTEIKLKLISAGIQITPVEEAKARLVISVDAIESNFSEHRILVQLSLYEDCITLRKDSPKTTGITYSDYSFFKDRVIEQSIYDKVMDIMLINFIESYLSKKTS